MQTQSLILVAAHDGVLSGEFRIEQAKRLEGGRQKNCAARHGHHYFSKTDPTVVEKTMRTHLLMKSHVKRIRAKGADFDCARSRPYLIGRARFNQDHSCSSRRTAIYRLNCPCHM